MDKTKNGKATKLLLIEDGQSLPISAFTTTAQVSEIKMIDTLVDIQAAGRRPGHQDADFTFANSKVLASWFFTSLR